MIHDSTARTNPTSQPPLGSTPAPAFASTAALVDAIRARRSVRTFAPLPLRSEHVALIRAYLADPERMRGPIRNGSSGSGRVVLLDEVGAGDREIGTYGYVTGYQAVLVGIARDQPRALVDLAYALHGLVLELTHADVGTVWLGAAFNRAQVLASTTLAAGELVGAMIPVGYATGQRLKEKLMRTVIRSDNRKPMDATFCLGDFATPLGSAGGSLRSALELARRAPSAKNKQSWRVIVSRDLRRLDVYAAFGLRHQVGVGRKMYACPPEYLDLGTFLRSLEIGLAADGVGGALVLDDPGLAPPAGADIEYIATFSLA